MWQCIAITNMRFNVQEQLPARIMILLLCGGAGAPPSQINQVCDIIIFFFGILTPNMVMALRCETTIDLVHIGNRTNGH